MVGSWFAKGYVCFVTLIMSVSFLSGCHGYGGLAWQEQNIYNTASCDVLLYCTVCLAVYVLVKRWKCTSLLLLRWIPSIGHHMPGWETWKHTNTICTCRHIADVCICVHSQARMHRRTRTNIHRHNTHAQHTHTHTHVNAHMHTHMLLKHVTWPNITTIT